jgi:type I site-specific restriction endonuclease
MLESARRCLRDMNKLIEVKRRPLVYTDFADEIGEVQEVVLSGAAVGTDMEQFRRKARGFLRVHQDHITIAKLRRNEALRPTDLAELERMLISEGGLWLSGQYPRGWRAGDVRPLACRPGPGGRQTGLRRVRGRVQSDGQSVGIPEPDH